MSAKPTPDHARVWAEIDSRPRSISRAAADDVWGGRHILKALALRQIKARYKQASIGIGWAVLRPVITAALFAAFVGHVVKIQSEGAPYMLFAMTGTVLWTFASTAIAAASEGVVTEAGLLRKIYFPREILPIAANLATMVDLVPSLAVLLVAAMFQGRPPGLAWLALPIPLALVVLATLGVGIALSALNVFYRDVRHILGFVMQLGLFATPVVYSLQAIPSRWRLAYGVANPVAAAIDGTRRIVLHGQAPDWTMTGLAIAWSVVVLLAGTALFLRLERGFADRV